MLVRGLSHCRGDGRHIGGAGKCLCQVLQSIATIFSILKVFDLIGFVLNFNMKAKFLLSIGIK